MFYKSEDSINDRNQQSIIENQSILYPGYPENPPFKPDCFYEEIKWFYNLEENWGCWIDNQYNKPFGIPISYEKAEKYGLHDRVYKSPIPLHEAKVPNAFRAHMCWAVNPLGWGQYVYYTRQRQTDGHFKGKYLYVTAIIDNT